MILAVFLLLGAVVLAVVLTVKNEPRPLKLTAREDRSGWVYFVAGDNTPVKIGMCHAEPTQQRLPELKTMSPTPLRIMAKFRVDDRFEAERRIHTELADSRLHGEWFDRDVALYYASHLRGEC